MSPEARTRGTIFLGVLGWLVSYAFFYRWLSDNDWRFFQGWIEAFTASDFGTGLLMDLVLVTAMMIFVALAERRRLGGRWVAAIIGSLALSVTMSLMLYLIACWQHREAERSSPPAAPHGT